MAREDRTASHTVELLAALQREPYAFDFFQAMRRMECAYPDQPRLGKSGRAGEDPIRLGQTPDLRFAASSIASFEPGAEAEDPGKMSVLFFGLFGPNGPLPLHLTEYARSRIRHFEDSTFASFVDIFHHRLLSLFYRAWADARPTVNFDRFDRPDPREGDRFSFYVGSTFGVGAPSLRGRDAISDLTRLHYAGTLSCQTRHAEGLEGMLADFFKAPVEIEQFIGQWIDIPEDGRLRLGESPDTGTLGRTSTIGASVWDCQQKFRIVAGPLGLVDYRRFLPDGDAMGRLCALVRGYVGDELVWDLKLILDRSEKPPLVLGGTGQLGWTTWLANRPIENDTDDLHLDPMARGFAHG